MKNRIRFNKFVVTIVELQTIERIVKLLSELAPSDAFISVDFNKSNDGFEGNIKISSSMENFAEMSTHPELLPLAENLNSLIMLHIQKWKENRFGETSELKIS